MYEGGGGCLGENVENWYVMCGLVCEGVPGLLRRQVGRGCRVGSRLPGFPELTLWAIRGLIVSSQGNTALTPRGWNVPTITKDHTMKTNTMKTNTRKSKVVTAVTVSAAGWESAETMATTLIEGATGTRSVCHWLCELTSSKAVSGLNLLMCKSVEGTAKHATALGIDGATMSNLLAFRRQVDAEAMKRGVIGKSAWASLKAYTPDNEAKLTAKAAARTEKAKAAKGTKVPTKAKPDNLQASVKEMAGLNCANAALLVGQVIQGLISLTNKKGVAKLSLVAIKECITELQDTHEKLARA